MGDVLPIQLGGLLIVHDVPDVATWGTVLVDSGPDVRTYQATDTATLETWTWPSNQAPPADLAGRTVEIIALAPS
jgi:hypothetical protein